MRVDRNAVSSSHDVDALWTALTAAKSAGDSDLVRAIEQRMRELQQTSRFGHLSDEELLAQIAGMTAHREPRNLMRLSGQHRGNDAAAGLASINQQIRKDQKVGVEQTLAALRDERARRKLPKPADD